MFPGAVPRNFTMGSRKVSYLISEATGPYFHTCLTEDVNASSSFYTLEYDETTNKQALNQLDILLRYGFNRQDCVNQHHLRTFLLGHATADVLRDKIVLSIEEGKLSLAWLLMLGSDGPNVNKSVWNKINDLVKEMEGRKTGLVNIGSCKLHVVHNCFGAGLKKYGSNIADLVIDINSWFKLSSARQEDFHSIAVKLGLEKQKFLKHVECRWLTLLPSISRLLDLWDAVQEYFLKYLPTSQPKVCDNARYNRIRKQIKEGETLVQLQFLKSMHLFNNFLTLFQKSEPLIHILHDRAFDLVILFLSRFVKKNVIEDQQRANIYEIDYKTSKHQLEDKSIEMGEEARKAMNLLPKDKHPSILLSVRNFYETVAGNLLEKLQFSNPLVRNCRCLQPTARRESWALHACKGVARRLPVNLDVDAVGDEWKLYQLENIPEEWYQEKVGDQVKPIRIDFYWRNIFKIKNCQGEPKYPSLTKLVKTALVLAHGNADVERGFSESGKTVTSQRTRLSERSINSVRSTADGLKEFGNKPHLVPIPKKLLSLAQGAHAHYIQRLEEEKKQKEKERRDVLAKEAEEQEKERLRDDVMKRKERLAEKEQKLSSQEFSEAEDLNLGAIIVKEANDKLKKALQKKDFKGIAVAQAMLEAGQKKVEEGAKNLGSIRKEQKKLRKPNSL